MAERKKIALFASGSGTNVENIANYFRGHDTIEIGLILSNNPDAFVLERAKKLDLPHGTFTREDFNGNKVLDQLQANEIDFVVLAGFLWLVPENLIKAYPDKIINIHPALLPKYGGKGMYGDKVHEAVVAACEKESGISIHYVNEKYDEGNIIYQEKCPVDINDTPEQVAEKVHQLEYAHYPKVIEKVVLGTL